MEVWLVLPVGSIETGIACVSISSCEGGVAYPCLSRGVASVVSAFNEESVSARKKAWPCS